MTWISLQTINYHTGSKSHPGGVCLSVDSFWLSRVKGDTIEWVGRFGLAMNATDHFLLGAGTSNHLHTRNLNTTDHHRPLHIR